MSFTPCQGKTACRDDGTRCVTCGWSLTEIARLRDAMDHMASIAIAYDHENIDAFAACVARTPKKMLVQRHAVDTEPGRRCS